MAEIAIAVPSSSSSWNGVPRTRHDHDDHATAPHAMSPSTLVSVSSSFCSGDRVRVTEVSIVGDLPHLGLHPGLGRRPAAAVPRVTEVFWNSMFDRSPIRTSPAGSVVAVLGHRRALPGQRRLLGLQRG